MRWFTLCSLLWVIVLLQNSSTVSAAPETKNYSNILPVRIVQKIIHGGYTAVDEDYTPCVDGVCPVPQSTVAPVLNSSCQSCQTIKTSYPTRSWTPRKLFSFRGWFRNWGWRFRR